ncbi:MAG: chemotaxis response regulator protein-glutamate methylesterase [Acidobacteria bacterium]|nr:chemotaxis response regulator protein-glutamate methylesterase [Acidobacteriota bacterium]
MSTRVLVVDDTSLFRRIVTDALAGIPGVEVAGSASNGKLALSRLAALQPDLMTLDLEMPEMGGLEVLEAMKAASFTTQVLVLSSHTTRGGAMTIKALELGAFDFITKPQGGTAEENLLQLRDRMMPILRSFERRREIRDILKNGANLPLAGHSAPQPPRPAPAVRPAAEAAPSARSHRRTGSPLIVIGVSTGGPAALAEVVPALPAHLAAPVFIVQHMPALFTQPLAQSLQSKSAIKVKEASDGEMAVAGCVYIAPGGRQMKLTPTPTGGIQIRVNDDAPENNCRPSVDYLFRSVALHFPGRAVAAILTGMGNDGAQGLKMLKRGGCHSIAQDEASCVVFGMPREAILTGMVDTVVPLKGIAPALLRAIEEATP